MTVIAQNANNPISFVVLESKVCNKCKQTKPIDEFYRSVVSSDGLEGSCKNCKIEVVREGQNRKKTKSLLSYKDIAPHKKWWLAENKLKSKAHNKVKYAIRTGELVRQPCERCGTTDNVVAHHEDYNKPLDIVWLCAIHHQERHKEINAMKEENKEDKVIDMINHPPHYTHGGIETIAYIRAKLSPEEYVGYLRGNIEKYNSRIGLKGESGSDAGKIKWYAIELDRFLNEA